jgi:signal transduction histidine kinase
MNNGERHAHAINGSGIVSPNWRAEILELAARAGNPNRPRLGRKPGAASLSRQSGVVLKVQNVEFRQELMGVVAVGFDASSRLWTPSAVESLLRGFCTHLAANLYVERRSSELTREQPDLESLCGLAKIGELIDPVAHEVNNFLNAALLHMAVMQSKLPAESRDDLTEIRQQGERLTETIRQLQQYRHTDCRVQRPVDLNSVVYA